MNNGGIVPTGPALTEATPNGLAGHGEAATVPMILIFGTDESPDEYMIPHRHLERLPPHVLLKILKGHTISLDGIRIHRLGGTLWHNCLLRLKQYLEYNDYYPFNPKAELQVVDSSGNISTWPKPSPAIPQSHRPHHHESLHTTDATHDLFRKEVGLYLFAVDTEYAELRNFSSSKICTGYPVFAEETFHLLESLYRIALGVNDMPLVEFVEMSIKQHRDSLVKLPRFVSILRRSVDQDPLSRVLLKTHIAASQAVQADLLLARIPVKGPVPTAPKGASPPRVETGLSTQLPLLQEALKHERLLVAKQDGYGTLVTDGAPSRNRDFTFVENELLLADYSGRPLNGKHNIAVENARGMRGDVLANLFVVVPPGLGVISGSVNCGIKTEVDREMRTDPYVEHNNLRSRSRSPTRR